MIRGDGIRRNIKSVDPDERAALRDAIIEMHHRYFPDGVSWWFKQDEIHQATHVHGGPEFLPWHREITNRFEAMLRTINPLLSLHYWDFADDPTNALGGNPSPLNLFDANFMGSAQPAAGQHDDPSLTGSGGNTIDNIDAGDPWLTNGFYDPLAGTPGHPDRDTTNNPIDPVKHISRTKVAPGALYPIASIGGMPFGEMCPSIPINSDDDILYNTNGTPVLFPTFRLRLECTHNRAHVYIANVSPHIAFRDPLVFLIHSNIDRIFAKWQTNPMYPE